MTTVKEIVIEKLKKMGADGLCDPGECGCGIEDLAPCDSPMACVPAKKSADIPEDLRDDYDEWYVPLED